MVVSSILTLSLNAVKPVELPKHLPQQTAIERQVENSLPKPPSIAHETETTYTFVRNEKESEKIFKSHLEDLYSGTDRPKPPSNTENNDDISPKRGDGRREN